MIGKRTAHGVCLLHSRRSLFPALPGLQSGDYIRVLGSFGDSSEVWEAGDGLAVAIPVQSDSSECPVTEPVQQRRTVYYSGRVQGVGFRFTARSVAQRYEVTGSVQNLDDGRVLLVTEGTPSELDRFLTDLSETMSRFIHDTKVATSPATGEFTTFSIER